MIKMLSAICRRPGMTHEEYIAYVHHVHGAISRENAATLRSYTQSHVFDSAFGSHSEASHSMVVSRDSVTELYWDSAEEMKATFLDEGVRARVGPDARNFSDMYVALGVIAEESEQPVSHPGQGSGAKVLHFMRAAQGLSLSEFFQRWEKAHRWIMENSPEAMMSVRRCVHSRQEPTFNEILSYFGDNPTPVYEGVASLWYDNKASISAFRSYENALLEINASPELAFYDPAHSFFLYATEVLIYER